MFNITRLRYPIHIVFLIVSLLVWSVFVLTDFRDNADLYYYLITHGLEDRRAMVSYAYFYYYFLTQDILKDKHNVASYKDFYEFIKFCDKNLLNGVAIAWVSNKGDAVLRMYLRQRAHYYLLPRNFRKEADFVIVYNILDYKRDGYEVFKVYGPGKFILQRKRQ